MEAQPLSLLRHSANHPRLPQSCLLRHADDFSTAGTAARQRKVNDVVFLSQKRTCFEPDVVFFRTGST